MVVRNAKLSDVESIVRLWKEFMKENNLFKTRGVSKVDQFNKNSYNLFRKYTIKNIRSNNCIVLVAEEKSVIIGFLEAQIKNHDRTVYKIKKTGYISDLFVKKNYRKRKVSSTLKNLAFKWFKSKNLKYVSLQTEMRNKIAHKIYKKWGFFEHHIVLFKEL